MAERKKAIELIGAAQAAEREALRLTRGRAGREGGERRPRRGGPRAGRGRCRCRQDPVAGAARARRDRGRGAAPDERGAQHAVAGGAHVGAAHADRREGRGHHPRIGQADGAHRGHQDPARRWPRRRRRAAATATAERRRRFADSVVNSALRFRAQAPLVDQLLREIGLEGGDIKRLVGGVAARTPRAAAGRAAEGARDRR